MFCKRCLSEVLGVTTHCPNCGERLGGGASQVNASTDTDASLQGAQTELWQELPVRPVNLNSHLAGAILVMLFFCLPLGIVSLVKAAEVPLYIAMGDSRSACRASESAAMWMWWGFGVGCFLWIIFILFCFA